MSFYDIRGSNLFRPEKFFRTDWEGDAKDILESNLSSLDKLWIVFHDGWLNQDLRDRLLYDLGITPRKLPCSSMPNEIALILDWASSGDASSYSEAEEQFLSKLNKAVDELKLRLK